LHPLLKLSKQQGKALIQDYSDGKTRDAGVVTMAGEVIDLCVPCIMITMVPKPGLQSTHPTLKISLWNLFSEKVCRIVTLGQIHDGETA
jgi:hypothetical protein